jgi:hypothetical protein
MAARDSTYCIKFALLTREVVEAGRGRALLPPARTGWEDPVVHNIGRARTGCSEGMCVGTSMSAVRVASS